VARLGCRRLAHVRLLFLILYPFLHSSWHARVYRHAAFSCPVMRPRRTCSSGIAACAALPQACAHADAVRCHPPHHAPFFAACSRAWRVTFCDIASCSCQLTATMHTVQLAAGYWRLISCSLPAPLSLFGLRARRGGHRDGRRRGVTTHSKRWPRQRVCSSPISQRGHDADMRNPLATWRCRGGERRTWLLVGGTARQLGTAFGGLQPAARRLPPRHPAGDGTGGT